jgi:flagellar basal body-associated protein FliL
MPENDTINPTGVTPESLGTKSFGKKLSLIVIGVFVVLILASSAIWFLGTSKKPGEAYNPNNPEPQQDQSQPAQSQPAQSQTFGGPPAGNNNNGNSEKPFKF